MTVAKRMIDRLVRRTSLFRETEKARDRALYRLEDERREHAVLEERVDAISKRLCSVSVQLSPQDQRRLRICLDLDAIIIEHGFLHGNDRTVIEHIGRQIGRQAAHEIYRANFQRWEV